jgi:hypothetical protein
LNEYEEKREISSGWSWFLVVALAGLIIAWGLFCFVLIKDGPRRWNFGALPDTPGQSIYSSKQAPEEAAPPRQVAPLPEARPRKGGAK